MTNIKKIAIKESEHNGYGIAFEGKGEWNSLHPNEYTQGLRYYPFAINFDRSMGSCNTLNDPPNRVCLQNKTKCSLVVSNLRSETKSSRFESGCKLCAEVSSLQLSPG